MMESTKSEKAEEPKDPKEVRAKLIEDISKAVTGFEILTLDMTKIHDEVDHLLDILKGSTFKDEIDLDALSITGSESIETVTVTGFTVDTLKDLETHATSIKTTAERMASTRIVLETLNSSIEVKATEVTKTEIAKLSDIYIQLMTNLSEFRIQLKIKFERLISKQLKYLGIPHNKRTLNKALETDFTPILLATRKGPGIIPAIEFFRSIKDCHVAVSSLDSSLYSLYDEFSKTAECLLKYDVILEAIVPPLEKAIEFTNYNRRVMQRAGLMEGDSYSIVFTPMRKRRILIYLIIIGVIGFCGSTAAFFLVLSQNVIEE